MARKSLDFDPKFRDIILQGKKIATIRKGRKKFIEGEIVNITFGGKKCCKARILRVRYMKYGELNEGDAIADGFKSLRELQRELEKFYGELKKDDVITQIVFEIIK